MKSTENSASCPGDGEIVKRLKFLENEIKVMSTKVGNLIVKIDSLEGVSNDSDSKSNSENNSLTSMLKSKIKASNGKKKKNAKKNKKWACNKGSESSIWGGKNLAWIFLCAIFAAVTVTLALGLGGENGRMDSVEPSLRTDEGLSATSGKGVGAFFVEKERMPRDAEDSLDGLERAFHSAETDGDLSRMKGRDRIFELEKVMKTKAGTGVGIEKVFSFYRKMNELRPKPETRTRKFGQPSLEESASNNIPRELTDGILYYPRDDGYCDTTPIPSMAGHETPEECCDEWYSSENENCLLRSNMYATTSPVASVPKFSPSSWSPTSALSTSSLSTSQAGNGGFHFDDASKNPSSTTTFPTSSISTSKVSRQATFEANVFFGSDPQFCGSAGLRQRDYRGTINTTFSGKACLRWDDNSYTAVDYPWAGLEDNYCRNPGEHYHAWCVNEDGDFEYCDVPLCKACKNSNFEKCGCREGNQADYRGSIHTTAGGEECLNWKETIFTPERYPWAGLEENYCRNPVGFDGQAWCFFGQNGWDYCDVPFCGEECENADPETCGCRNSQQRDYRGSINTTADGTECMRWEDLIGSYTPKDFPLDGLEENYCRNPGGSLDKAYCWDVEGAYQHCNVPYCDEISTSTLCQESDPDECECANIYEKNYTGTVNVTRSGLPCANWDDYDDSIVFETLPPGSVNYCSNPDLRLDIYGFIADKRDRAWCYTKDKSGGPLWDYCDIPLCGGNGAICEADKTTCGCRNVDFADYRGDKSYDFEGYQCDGWNETDIIDIDAFPNAGLEGHNFCRNPNSSPYPWCSRWGFKARCYVPSCDPCSCKPPNCNLDSNTESCGCPSALQAHDCCEESNEECKCEYLKVACRKSIEIGKADFCDEAFDMCCGGTADCMCNVTSSICFDNPGSVCNVAADYCCSSPDADSYRLCKCDFINYVDSFYQVDFSRILHSCTITSKMDSDDSTEVPLILGDSVFDDPLICDDCTMCCNSRSECYPTEETNIQKSNFSSYEEFSWVFFVSVIGFAITIYLTSYTLSKYKHQSEPIQSNLQRRESMQRRAKKYAVDKMGQRSVYSFFLGKNWCGWMIALAILGVQLWVLFVFVIGAEQDLSDDNSDFMFTWKCFRDEETCSNDADLDATGWIIFGILMTSHLLPDIINGAKMVVLSGKVCYDFNQRARFFFGGLLLITVTAFTLFTSVVYNKAIATSNTEIVTNAVIILFITDLDEQCFRLFKCIDDDLIKWFGGNVMIKQCNISQPLLVSLQLPFRLQRKLDLFVSKDWASW